MPRSARLGLELDASVADEPKQRALAPDALFALRSRNLEQTDSFLYSVYHLTGLRRLDLLDCSLLIRPFQGCALKPTRYGMIQFGSRLDLYLPMDF